MVSNGTITMKIKAAMIGTINLKRKGIGKHEECQRPRYIDVEHLRFNIMIFLYLQTCPFCRRACGFNYLGTADVFRLVALEFVQLKVVTSIATAHTSHLFSHTSSDTDDKYPNVNNLKVSRIPNEPRNRPRLALLGLPARYVSHAAGRTEGKRKLSKKKGIP